MALSRTLRVVGSLPRCCSRWSRKAMIFTGVRSATPRSATRRFGAAVKCSSSLRLLLHFTAAPKRRVADLGVADLTPVKIIAFLDHLEQQRGNDPTTRNVRLSAIHSFFDYLGAEWPEHLDQARRVLAITFKRTAHRTIDYLEAEELRTILEQIDRRNVWGRRDYVLLA